jgi:hypothetical protein
VLYATNDTILNVAHLRRLRQRKLGLRHSSGMGFGKGFGRGRGRGAPVFTAPSTRVERRLTCFQRLGTRASGGRLECSFRRQPRLGCPREALREVAPTGSSGAMIACGQARRYRTGRSASGAGGMPMRSSPLLSQPSMLAGRRSAGLAAEKAMSGCADGRRESAAPVLGSRLFTTAACPSQTRQAARQ